jgi:hypothetical protein
VIDPSIIDEKISAARDRDNAVCAKLLAEMRSAHVIAPNLDVRTLDLNNLMNQLLPAKVGHSGVSPGAFQQLPSTAATPTSSTRRSAS